MNRTRKSRRASLSVQRVGPRGRFAAVVIRGEVCLRPCLRGAADGRAVRQVRGHESDRSLSGVSEPHLRGVADRTAHVPTGRVRRGHQPLPQGQRTGLGCDPADSLSIRGRGRKPSSAVGRSGAGSRAERCVSQKACWNWFRMAAPERHRRGSGRSWSESRTSGPSMALRWTARSSRMSASSRYSTTGATKATSTFSSTTALIFHARC